ncbi:MAG: DUF4960 domain-containing protein [Chitinophagaceae bacterium]
MKKASKYLSALMLAAVYLLGCSKDKFATGNLQLDTDVKISSFAVGAIQGVINDSTDSISITVPFGFDRTSVSPTITVASSATVSPASGTAVDMTSSVTYKVINGNIYKTYSAVAKETPAIESFVVGGVTGTINETNRTITASVSPLLDLTALAPEITLADGASISPTSGTTVDFTNPVTYTVTKDTATVTYTVTVTTPETVAFLGTAASASDISNVDENAAWTWLSSVNSLAEYVSFTAIKKGTVDLTEYKIVWWHEDDTQTLPTIASDATVLATFQTYYADGGNFLLSSFAALYVDALGIVPSGKGPNNAWSDSPVWLEATYPWGISFAGHEDHAAFAGLTLTSDKAYATAYMLSNGCYRHNNTAQWHIGTDWGDFGTAAVWRSETGGIDLGSSEGDQYHSSQVTMAEFAKTDAHGAAIVIGAGCYDWYSEADPTNSANQPTNAYISNIQLLTNNVLGYLSKQ